MLLPALVDYSSTKGAITALPERFQVIWLKKRSELMGSSWSIWTPLIPATLDKEKVKKFETEVPLGRAGQPSEVAPAYVFLASEDAIYFTGQILHPNGGVVVNA